MVRVVYGVSSEGMGHATRAVTVIQYLESQGHEVHIFTGDRVYDFLKQQFKHIHRIKGLHLSYDDNKLDYIRSTANLVKILPKALIPTFITLLQKFRDIKPQVIVSDYELFTSIAGKFLRIPVIGVSNISILTKANVTRDLKTRPFVRSLARLSDRALSFYANKYVIPTFFFPKPKGKKVTLVDITVREIVEKQKPKRKDFILVYHTTKSFTSLLDAIKKVPNETFKVYGFGKKRNTKNVTFYDFSDSFITDLANCKAVITGGGFSTLSEAIYLKKPVLCAYTDNHYEQIINAHYLWLEKFGEFTDNISPTVVKDFLLKLPLYETYLQKKKWDSGQYKKTIEKLVRQKAKS